MQMKMPMMTMTGKKEVVWVLFAVAWIGNVQQTSFFVCSALVFVGLVSVGVSHEK